MIIHKKGILIMKKESEIRQRLEKEINAFLTCPKFAVEEHANYIYSLAWVLDMTDSEVDELLRQAEKS
jgi:hypothetical protein